MTRETTTNAGTSTLHEDLRCAAIEGKVDQVVGLIQEGADVIIRNTHNNTALHLAVFYGHVKVVEVLLKNGARLDVTNTNGQTPLQLAAVKGHLPIVNQLTVAGCDLHAKTAYSGMTALHFASKEGYAEICQHLLDVGAEEEVLDEIDKTAEYYAANYPTELVFKKWRQLQGKEEPTLSNNATSRKTAPPNSSSGTVPVGASVGAAATNRSSGAPANGTTPITISSSSERGNNGTAESRAGSQAEAGVKKTSSVGAANINSKPNSDRMGTRPNDESENSTPSDDGAVKNNPSKPADGSEPSGNAAHNTPSSAGVNITAVHDASSGGVVSNTPNNERKQNDGAKDHSSPAAEEAGVRGNEANPSSYGNPGSNSDGSNRQSNDDATSGTTAHHDNTGYDHGNKPESATAGEGRHGDGNMSDVHSTAVVTSYPSGSSNHSGATTKRYANQASPDAQNGGKVGKRAAPTRKPRSHDDSEVSKRRERDDGETNKGYFSDGEELKNSRRKEKLGRSEANSDHNDGDRAKFRYNKQEKDPKKIPTYKRQDWDREKKKFGYDKGGGNWQKVKDHSFVWSDEYKSRQQLGVFDRLLGGKK